ncbi:MAG: NAD-binding protein, partial [Acetobacteraceae bacterium]
MARRSLTMQLGIYRLRDWFLLAPIGAAGVILGIVGFEQCPATEAACHVPSFGAAILRTIFLIRPSTSFTFENAPATLVIAQFLMFVLLLLVGLMGSIKLFARNLSHDVHLARAQAMRGHVVVCGLGETGLEIVQGLRRQGQGVVAVTREDNSEGVASCERLGVPVLSGDASRVETLDHAGVRRARAVIATTGSDAINLEIAAAAGRRTAGRTDPLLVRPEIRAPWLIDAMAAPATSIFDPTLLVHPLRVQNLAARLLLGRPVFTLFRGARRRLVIVGLGDLGAAILKHAALSTFALPDVALDVVCYDKVANARAAVFSASPWQRFLALEPRPARFGPAEDPAQAADWAAIAADFEHLPPDAVVIALQDDDAALAAALGFRDALDRLHHFATPVFVRIRRADRLRQMLSRIAERPLCPERLVGFGDFASLLGPEQLFDQPSDRMARAVHAAYLASQKSAEGPAAVPWDRLAERFRRSNREAADHLPVKLAFAGLRLAPGPGPGVTLSGATLSDGEVARLAEAEHFRWCRVLKAAGTRAGPRDEAAKTHHLLVPWLELPEAVRADNLSRMRDLPAIAAEAGRVICRLVPTDPAGRDPDPDAIGVIAIACGDIAAWRAAEAMAGRAAIAVHVRGIARAKLADLVDL